MVCLAQLMNVLDTTIVNVALPSIQRDLHFSQGNLTWVINAFLITFGSFLLLAGRLGDLIGRKRVFLAGVALFTRRLGARAGSRPSQGVLIARPLRPGHRRRAVGLGDPRDHRDRVPRARRPRPRDERLRVRRRRRRLARPARRRRAHPGRSAGTGSSSSTSRSASPRSLLGRALDPRTTRGSGLGARRRLARLGARDARADDRRLRDRAGDRARLGLVAGARLRRRSRSRCWPPSSRSSRASRTRSCRCGSCGCAGCRLERRARLPRHRDVLDVLPRHALPRARAPLRRARRPALAFLPWTITVGILSLGVTARLVARFGPMRVLVAGLGGVIVGLGAARDARAPHTSFFPTIFLAYFAIGLGRRQLVHAAADDRDGRRAAPPTPASARGSSTSPSRSPARSAWPCSARSRPTARRRSRPAGHALGERR